MKRKLCGIAALILAMLAVLTAGDIWLSANWLTTKEYEYRTKKAQQDIHFVVLSDMHDHEFGKKNERLVKKVKALNPDFILLVGDMLNEDSKNSDIVCELIRSLKESAPVYCSLGNAEESYIENKEADLIEKLEQAGADVLEEKYIDFELRGTKLRLGGMYDYAFGLNGNNEVSAIPEKTGTFLRKFQDTDRIKIMMAHRPDSFIFGDAASYWNVDFVVSGHNHGGQVVVPFKGGLYGGDQGWFPKYVHGMYKKDGIEMFITSGLGSGNQKLPRFHNLPEIAVVKIKY